MLKKLLSLLLTFTFVVYSNTCVTTAAGNWSAAGTWTSCGSGVPGNGDTATIAHAVTVDVDTTVGTSPSDSTTIILTISTNKVLTIAAGKTLTVRGNVTWNGGIVMSTGSSLVMDPTQAATRGSAEYILGPDNYDEQNYLQGTACTSGSHCTVKTLRTNGDEGRAWFSLNGYVFRTNLFNVTYTDFIDLGSASNPLAHTYIHSNSGLTYSPAFFVTHSTFTRCGPIQIENPEADSIVQFENNTFASSLQTANVYGASSASLTTGTRTIIGNYIDGRLGGDDPNGSIPTDFTITDNVFGGGMRLFSTNWASFTSNVLFSSVAGQPTLADISNSVLVDNESDNPHFFIPSITGSTLTYDGVILEYAGAGSEGDGFVLTGSGMTSAKTVTIQNSLILSSATSSSGAAATLVSWGNLTDTAKVNAYHNTQAGGTGNWDHGLFFNECVGTCTLAGTILGYKSNLLWFTSTPGANNPPTGPGGNHFMYLGTPTDNILSNGGAGNNTCWNCKTATVSGPANGTMYNVPLAVGQTVPGTNDLDMAPGFADPTRTVEKWAAFKGQAATLAGAKTQLATNPTAMIADLLNYLRAGYAPMNVQLATAAHDSSYIGAVKPVLMFGVINQ